MQMKQKGSRKAGRVLWEEVGTERQANGWEDQTRDMLQARVKEPWEWRRAQSGGVWLLSVWGWRGAWVEAQVLLIPH